MKKYILPIVLALALIATAVWGYYQYNERMDYHTYLDLQFQRQFYDLIGHVENTQVDLAKAMVSGSSKDTVKFLNNTVQQAYLAQEKLTQLPFHHGSIRKTEKFLNQLGDYCTAMVNKSLEGIVLSAEELKTMEELHTYSNYLSQQLINLQKQIVSNGVNFGDLRREGNQSLDQAAERIKDFNNLISIEERMQEYPELIYDGPFSEHLKDTHVYLKGNKVSEEDAIKIMKETFSDYNLQNVSMVEKIENTKIPGYYIKAEKRTGNRTDEVTGAISQIDGKIIWYINPRNIKESNLDKEKAIAKGQAFLQSIGYENMVPTYTMAYEGQIIINFAYKQNNVIIYPDLIKVKVALDDGEIIGVEAEGYLVNHHQRSIDKPKLSEKEARERLSSAAKEENVRLTIIPTAGNKEVLCYEFKVSFGKDNYLVYIDANTGKQVKLLLMVEQEDGTLVI